MIALYGGVDLSQLRRRDYGLYVALWLDRFRSIDRQSMPVNRAILSVFGKAMDEQYYHNVTETEDQAAYAHDVAKAKV